MIITLFLVPRTVGCVRIHNIEGIEGQIRRLPQDQSRSQNKWHQIRNQIF